MGRFSLVQPTHAPSPEELNQLLSARVRELERHLHELETTAGQIANAALSLAYSILERDGRGMTEGVVINGSVTRDMVGARLILGQVGDDLVVRIGER